MCPLATLRITVCGILLAADWVKVGGADASTGPLPVPSLSFRTPINGSNIELFSDVELLCTPPEEAPYPMVLILGRDTQPRTEVLSFKLENAAVVRYTLSAESKNEGAFVCWYTVHGTEESSEASNSVNITISSLPPPTVTYKPDFIPVGRNYTVHCQAPDKFTNITLSIYYRELNSSTPEQLQLLGSLTLEGAHTAIEAKMANMAAGARVEYFCRMEVFYSQHLYKSPLSTSVTATAEEAPVRLVSKFQGPKCAGTLQMFARGSWAPVCQDRSQRLSERAAVGLVVCRQLGCGDVLLTVSARDSSVQQGAFFMGPVECSGKEASLRECSIQAFRRDCYSGTQVEIVCSAFLPPPTLSVTGRGRVSSVYVHEKSPLEISCMLPQWLPSATVDLVEVRDGRTARSSAVSPGEPAKWELQPPVRPGEYACRVTFYGFNRFATSSASNSVIVTTGSWLPPSTGLIVGALLMTLIGAGILVYMCVYRVHKEGSQENLAPQEAQGENPVFSCGEEHE